MMPSMGMPMQPQMGTVVGYTKEGAPIIVQPSAGQIAASMDVLNTLVQVPGVYVAQSVDLLEMLVGCERVNRYKVQPWDPARGEMKVSDGILAPPFMKMKEQSECLTRQCCGPMRNFSMSLYPYADGQYPPQGADIFHLPGAVIIERPWRCTIGGLPCWRPVMRVRHSTVGYIGEIRQPSCGPFFNFHFDVFSPNRGPGDEDMLPGAPLHVHPSRGNEAPGTKWYTIKGDLCQIGMFCFFPLMPACKKVVFNIYDARDVEHTTPIGSINKVWKDCCVSLLAETDSYTIVFPPTANEVQRATLIAAAILIDFRLYEKGQNEDDKPGGILGNILSAVL